MAFLNSKSGKNFDSKFEPAGATSPAKLRIILKVTLVPLDPSSAWARSKHSSSLPEDMAASTIPPSHIAQNKASIKFGNVVDANGTGVRCRSWLASEWLEFTRRFKQSVEHSWNNQMIFLPTPSGVSGDALNDRDYRVLIGNPRIPAHVEGVLQIDLQPSGSIGHAIIEVAHLASPGDSFRDRMTRITDESVQFSSSTFKNADRGIRARTGQIAAAHEVGHWLREPGKKVFKHIDRDHADTLPESEQDDAQYGRTLGRYYSLMGGGSVVGEHEASVWLARLRDHSTLKHGWTLVHKLRFNLQASELSARQRRLLGSS